MRILIRVCIVLFLLVTGCAGGGGGSRARESASETLYLCSLDSQLDEATRRAVVTIRDRLVVDIWGETIPPGARNAQRTITHEALHALTGRVDHVEASGNLMHAAHDPHQVVFGPQDDAYVAESRQIAYTDDMGLCDVDIRFGDVADLGCPSMATGCWYDEEIVLNDRYRWFTP